MIRATYRADGGVYELRVVGHAGYCPGNDIVCAGCSAILYALVGALRSRREPVAYDLESGDAWVKAQGGEVVEALFHMAAIGLRQIEQAHPEHVRVKDTGGDRPLLTGKTAEKGDTYGDV